MNLQLKACPRCSTGAVDRQDDIYGKRDVCVSCGYATEIGQVRIQCDNLSMPYIGIGSNQGRAYFTVVKIRPRFERILKCPRSADGGGKCTGEMSQCGEAAYSTYGYRRKLTPFSCGDGHKIQVTAGWSGWL